MESTEDSRVMRAVSGVYSLLRHCSDYTKSALRKFNLWWVFGDGDWKNSLPSSLLVTNMSDTTVHPPSAKIKQLLTSKVAGFSPPAFGAVHHN
jgi:hypothetical protein